MRRTLLYMVVLTTILVVFLTGCRVKIMIEADVVVPDNLKATTRISVLGIKVFEQEMIGISETVYIWEPNKKEWELSTEYPDVGTMASLDIVTLILESLRETSIVNDEGLDSETCYHLKGSLDSEILNEMGFNEAIMDIEGYEDYTLETERLEIECELWINRKDYLVHHVIINGYDCTNSDLSDKTLQIVMEFSDYNQPITITEPGLK